MAIQKTRWKPDTCECVLEYEWDSDLPIDKRGHALANIIQRCVNHITEPDLFGKVVNENSNKNIVLNQIKELLPAADISYSFTSNRELEISGLTIDQKQIVKDIDVILK